MEFFYVSKYEMICYKMMLVYEAGTSMREKKPNMVFE